MNEPILFYRTRDAHGFLSNFWPGNPILVFGHVFRTSEHLYQALKVSHIPEEFRGIRDAKNAKEAAALGRATAGVRKDWDQARVFAMRLALLLKFEDAEARALLLDTGDADLVEHTPDPYWGDGVGAGGPGWVPPPGVTVTGPGKNMLGKLLVETRTFYRGLRDATVREEAAEISSLQAELMSRLSTREYLQAFPTP